MVFLIIIAIVAIVAITGLILKVRARVKHAPTISSIDSYDVDSLGEVAEGLVVKDLGKYTITSFVTKRGVGIDDLCDNKYTAVFIRVTRDDWAFFDNGNGMRIPEKTEVKIYSSGYAAYYSGDEFMIAHLSRYRDAELVTSIEETVLKRIAENIEFVWHKGDYEEPVGANLTLNKDAVFVDRLGSRLGFALIAIEEGKESLVTPHGKIFTLPKGARIFLYIRYKQ
jgi:hypothetical protein